MAISASGLLLGHVAPDSTPSTNERAVIRVPARERPRVLRNQFVTITDALDPQTVFLARLITGPFFPRPLSEGGEILAHVEIQGELRGEQT
jgi:hypothetical protein